MNSLAKGLNNKASGLIKLIEKFKFLKKQSPYLKFNLR